MRTWKIALTSLALSCGLIAAIVAPVMVYRAIKPKESSAEHAVTMGKVVDDFSAWDYGWDSTHNTKVYETVSFSNARIKLDTGGDPEVTLYIETRGGTDYNHQQLIDAQDYIFTANQKAKCCYHAWNYDAFGSEQYKWEIKAKNIKVTDDDVIKFRLDTWEGAPFDDTTWSWGIDNNYCDMSATDIDYSTTTLGKNVSSFKATDLGQELHGTMYREVVTFSNPRIEI